MRVCTYNKKLEMIGAIIDESSVTNRGVGKHLASFVPHCTLFPKPCSNPCVASTAFPLPWIVTACTIYL